MTVLSRVSGAAGSLLLLVLTLLAVPAPAQADLQPQAIITCTNGSPNAVSLKFEPGLGLTARPTHVTGSSQNFTCSDGKVGRAQTVSVHAEAACSVSTNSDGNIVFKWQGGFQSSDFKVTAFAATLTSASKVIIMEGTIQSGTFNGAAVKLTVTSLGDTTRCTNGTFVNTNGPLVLVITT